MKAVVTPRQALEIDSHMMKFSKIPGLLLMEQASTAVARAVMDLVPGGRVLLLCGNGNNGGDGLAVARILLTHGYDVHVACDANAKRPPDSAVNYEFWKDRQTLPLEPHVVIDVFDVIVDALFGTGLSRPLEGKYEAIANAVNECTARVVAVDIPSGVCGLTASCDAAIKADVTVTFQHAKPGHLLYPGAEYTGELIVAPIGVHSVKTEIFHYDESTLPERKRNSNKGTYGKAGIIAGSKGMAGAAVLATLGSIRSGAGLTKVFACEYVADILQYRVSEATVTIAPDNCYFTDMSIPKVRQFLQDCTSIAIGPGLSTDISAEFAAAVLGSDVPKVADADALNKARNVKFGKNTIITPHPREFARLADMDVSSVLADPLGSAKAYAREHGVVCLLKGAATVVSDGQVSGIVTQGSAGMAKGGSGDVLSGVIAGLLAQGISPLTAALEGAYLCGSAGQRAQERKNSRSMTPSDVLEEL